MTILDEHPFALCLTHDVDRVYKTYQTVYYAVTDREPRHLLDLLPGRNPYWQFEEIMALEADLGVRSAFYVLVEQNLFRDKPPRAWLRPENWKLYTGRYSPDEPAVAEALAALDSGGWEIGLHGSYDSYRDPDRLREEKSAIEAVVDQRIVGGRQHYLNLDRPGTWEHHADIGLGYDATLGSTDDFGFQHGYEPLRPFDDEFTVFPLTLMEYALPDVETNPEAAWCHCLSLLEEARENNAVMSVLWHPTYFSEREHPNYKGLYRRLIERAQEMGAWVGPPGELYRSLDHPSEAATESGHEDGALRPTVEAPASAAAVDIGSTPDPSTDGEAADAATTRHDAPGDGNGTVDAASKGRDVFDAVTNGSGAVDAATNGSGTVDAAGTSEDD